MARLTVLDLIAQVRSLLDEDSQFAIDDEKDIVPALNRAQDNASSILAKMYESPLLASTTFTLPYGGQEFDIPEDALEERIESVEAIKDSYHYPLKRIDFRDLGNYETSVSTDVPYYYAVIANRVKVVPPAVGCQLKVWYLRDAPDLVKEHGQITSANVNSNYVTLSSISETLSTASDELASYVNLVDRNGNILSSHQVSQIVGQRVTFRSTPTRNTVMGRTISSTLPSTVAADMYLAPIQGSCITYLKKPLSNYLIQYAVAELTRKLGGESQAEVVALKELEKTVERSWAGRENSNRVRATSNYWWPRNRRWRL